MGTIVTGAGSMNNNQSMMTGMLTIKNVNNPYARMSVMRNKEKKPKKPLNYNHREVSGQLMRAKKAQNAAGVLMRAKGKLATLQRQAGTGQYDSREIANALAHARQMVRCAQLKVRNLREEEQEQIAQKREGGVHDQQRENEIKCRVAQKQREIKQKVVIEEMQEVVKEKRKRNELLQKQQSHRNQEQNRINEADMKYIKAELDRNHGVSGYQSFGNVTSLDLNMEMAAMAEVQMLEQTLQMEAEVEGEVSAEIAMSGGTAVSYGGGNGQAFDVATGSAIDVSV